MAAAKLTTIQSSSAHPSSPEGGDVIVGILSDLLDFWAMVGDTNSPRSLNVGCGRATAFKVSLKGINA